MVTLLPHQISIQWNGFQTRDVLNTRVELFQKSTQKIITCKVLIFSEVMLILKEALPCYLYLKKFWTTIWAPLEIALYGNSE